MRCISGHSQYVELETIERPLWKNTWEEPSYDLPNASKPRDQDHEDESTAAPKSIEQDRKIVPFRKKAVTFMFHATYGTQIEKIMQQGIKPGRTSTPRGRQHVHMACIDGYDDQESDAALAHVPKGRDALLILAFTQDNQYNIRITEERIALSEYTIDPCSIIAAFDTDGQPLMHSHWIMKKNLDHDDREQCEPKIQEFAEHFFKHIDKGISHDKHN